MQTTFLFCSFSDNLNNHSMINFSILSLKKYAPANSRFLVYTVTPENYKYLSSMIEIRPLDEKKIEDWRGPHDFMWRIKIMAMLDSAQNDPGHLVYLDGDTFAKADLSSMIEELDKGICFMHVKESLLSQDKDDNKCLMWKQIKNKEFGGMVAKEDSAMWNAGVVALDEKSKVELLQKSLRSTDGMCEADVTKWLIEQFSMSQALASTGKLKPADQWFAHYWGNKEELILAIKTFFTKTLMQMLSIDEAIASIDICSWKKLLEEKPKKTFFQKLFRN